MDNLDTTGMTLEDRVARIERLIGKLLTVAEAHPMGKTLMKMIGL